jgi:hypothetical protein
MNVVPEIQTAIAIACNASTATSIFSKGAAAFVVDYSTDRARLPIRSRSGRWVRAWVSLNNVVNFRLKNIPKEHSLFQQLSGYGSGGLFSSDDLAVVINRAASRHGKSSSLG